MLPLDEAKTILDHPASLQNGPLTTARLLRRRDGTNKNERCCAYGSERKT